MQNIVEKQSVTNIILDKILSCLIKAMLFAFKFSFYLCMLFLQLIINVIQYCLNWVFESYFERWDYYVRRREDKENELLKIEILEDNKTYKHLYKMSKNKQYETIYEELENYLGLAIEYDREIAIDKRTAQDIFLKIDKLTQNAERNAVQEGYKFCIDTNGKYINRDVYLEYMRERILRED